MKFPVVELDECILCGVCEDVCPEVFHLNDSGYIEVKNLSKYPEEEVNEVLNEVEAALNELLG